MILTNRYDVLTPKQAKKDIKVNKHKLKFLNFMRDASAAEFYEWIFEQLDVRVNKKQYLLDCLAEAFKNKELYDKLSASYSHVSGAKKFIDSDIRFGIKYQEQATRVTETEADKGRYE